VRVRVVDTVTSCDHVMVMDTVRIADLKARLSEHLRAVRRYRTLTGARPEQRDLAHRPL
jgi:hypothetical protein